MASDTDFIDYVIEQIGLGARLTRKRMFGEYALYLDDKVFAFVCDNSVLLKPTAAVARMAPDLPQRPPYPGAKAYPVADELLDDGDRLRAIIVRSAALLPEPKVRKTAKQTARNVTGAAAAKKAPRVTTGKGPASMPAATTTAGKPDARRKPSH